MCETEQLISTLMQVYQRLQKLNVIKNVGENHDEKVKSWKIAIVNRLKNSKVYLLAQLCMIVNPL